MTRELATSREIATREVSNRSNQYIVENDWMIQSTSPNGIVTIDHIADFFNDIPFTFSFISVLHGQDQTRQLFNIAMKSPSPYHYYFRIYYNLGISSVYWVFINELGTNMQGVLNWQKESKIMTTIAVDSSGMVIYINKNKTTIGWTGPAAGLGELTDTSYLCLGGWYGIATGGLIDYSHLAIYNKKLTSEEVEDRVDILSSGQSLEGTEDGLVCYFPCQEGSGNLITDIVGGKTGILASAEWRQYGGLREVA